MHGPSATQTLLSGDADQIARLERELAEALEYQTAISDVLAVISHSPSDLRPVLDTIAEIAERLCGADRAQIFTERDGMFHLAAHRNTSQEFLDYLALHPFEPGMSNTTGRAVLQGRTIHAPDVLADPTYDLSRPMGSPGGARLSVPLLHDGRAIGVITVSRAEPRAFTDRQIGLVTTFASQAVIAINNARLFEAEQTRTRELAESLEYQTATSAVLSIISKSPGALEPVFQAMLDNAVRVCGASFGNLLLYDGEKFTHVALHNAPSGWVTEQERDPVPPRELARVLYQVPEMKRRVHIADLMTVNPDEPIATKAGARTLLIVPMLNQNQLVGVIAVYRQEVRPFTEKQIELLETFADQAVIAIENARLFEAEQTRTRELTEALEYQTAISEVLGVISRSQSDLQPVLDSIARTAARLCQADKAVIRRRQGEGFVAVASFGHTPEMITYIESRPAAIGRGSMVGRVALEHRTVHIPDVATDPEYTRADLVQATGFRSGLAVPLLREGDLLGVVLLLRDELQPFTAREIALVETFAKQAVIAIENARLLDELQTRQRELTEALESQTATGDVLRAISRFAFDLKSVLEQLVQSACILCGADFGHIRRRTGTHYPVAASFGLTEEEHELFASYPGVMTRGSVPGRAFHEKHVVHFPDVLDDPEFTYKGLAKAAGFRASVGVPLISNEEVVGILVVNRRTPGPFSKRQIKLFETFADQAVIAIENARLLDELQTRQRELTEALEYQTATSEVLGVISRSPNELQPVLDVIADNAARVCMANDAHVFRIDGQRLRSVAHYGSLAVGREVLADGLPVTRGTVTGRALLDRKTIHVEDLAALADTEYPDAKAPQQLIGYRTTLATPLQNKGVAYGAIVIRRMEVRPFTPKQIALLETFADQAVIAINNVGLFEEVQARTREVIEALEYQTATADVLSVISKSPNELQPVLDSIMDTALRLCRAERGSILRLDGDGFRPVAFAGNAIPSAFKQRFLSEPAPADRSSITGRVALDKQPVHIIDARAEPGLSYLRSEVDDRRTMLGVPLLRHGAVVGVIMLVRTEVQPFTDKQIDLVATFADQAVIAINNVGLFEQVQARTAELTESLEYQTATNGVLSVISRSPDKLQPVLDEIVVTSARLCEAEFSMLFRGEGEVLQLVANNESNAAFVQYCINHPVPLTPSSNTGRAAVERCTIHTHDVRADPENLRIEAYRLGGQRTVLSVPLLRDGRALGVITLMRSEVRPFTQRQIDLVTTFANQAVIAISNAQLFEEVQARSKDLARSVEELRSLGEVGQAVNSTLDVGKVLQTVLENACRIANAGGGTVYAYDTASGEFRVEAGYNMSEEHIARVRAHPMRLGDRVVGECAERREAVQIEDLARVESADVPLLDILARAGVRAILAVPLMHQGEVVGALVIRRSYPGAFAPETVRLLEAFAAQSAIAVNNARLFAEVEEKGEQLRLASQHKSQFLANMSHELRTPLNAILGYTELMQDGIYGALPEKAGGVLGRVQSNGQHLLGLINSVLDLSKIEAGQLQLDIVEYGMPAVVEAVVVATESLAIEKKLKLEANVADNLPRGLGDERRITQVLLNLVGNAIKFTEQGAVTIDAALKEDRFLVSVADTGPGIPAAEQERVFEEFHQVDSSNTKAKGGTGLGLAIAKRIIEMHGGRIWVESTPGQGATFRFELPVSVKQSEGDDEKAHARSGT